MARHEDANRGLGHRRDVGTQLSARKDVQREIRAICSVASLVSEKNLNWTEIATYLQADRKSVV